MPDRPTSGWAISRLTNRALALPLDQVGEQRGEITGVFEANAPFPIRLDLNALG
jgi:hypothetical protein